MTPAAGQTHPHTTTLSCLTRHHSKINLAESGLVKLKRICSAGVSEANSTDYFSSRRARSSDLRVLFQQESVDEQDKNSAKKRKRSRENFAMCTYPGIKYSTASDSNTRSSGYFSNPHSSDPRLSEILVEHEIDEEERCSSALQWRAILELDESDGLAIQTADFNNSFRGGVVTRNKFSSASLPSLIYHEEPVAETPFSQCCYQLTRPHNVPVHTKMPYRANSSDLLIKTHKRSQSLPISHYCFYKYSTMGTSTPSTSCTSLDKDNSARSQNGSSITATCDRVIILQSNICFCWVWSYVPLWWH